MPKNARGLEYNKELREQIKDAGRELIDRADEIVHPKTEGIVGLDIHFTFSQGELLVPTMSYTMEVIRKNTLERWKDVGEPECEDCQYSDQLPLQEPCFSCFDGNNFVRKE